LKKAFHARVTKPGKRTYQLIENLFTQPVISIPEQVRRSGATYRTAKRDLEKLVKDGILAEVSGTHPRIFYAKELMQAAYDWSDWD
jgi:Fic family protein